MPELPEVETTRRGIEPHLLQRRVRDVLVRNASLRWPVPDSIHQLIGQVFTRIERRAKYLLLHTESACLILHLGMSGSLRISQPDIPLRRHDHLVLFLDSGLELRFHDPRRFGAALWTDENPLSHVLLRDLGPEPLGTAFTAKTLHTQCQKRSSPIKQVIMDAKVVVGVGNIYACEALFMARISPTKSAKDISRPRLERLVQCIQEVLSHSIELGGTTLRDFVNEQGQAGYFQQTLRVYGREGEPCRSCASPVQRLVLGQRSTFFCPKCQAR